MLRYTWAIFAGGTVIAGLVAGKPGVVALGVLLAVACYGATLWARYSLRRVAYRRLAPEDHAFPGERLTLHLRVANNKLLPLPWIEVRERFPAQVVESGGEFGMAGQVTVVQTDWRTSIGAHERVSRSYELQCPDRGIYEVGPTRLRSGDPFGLFHDDRMEERRTRVVVYPRTLDGASFALPARRPYGEEAGGLSVFEDPLRVSGLRDYQPGDSLRRIDWSATARIGRLQSRVFDPASARHLLVCLNTQTTIPMWSGVITEVLERSITVAASISREAYDERYSVGLLANCTFPEADRSMRFPPGRRPEQFIRILEALATVTSFVLEPLSAMLDREEHRLALGTTIAAVTGVMTDDLAGTLLRLARRGHTVVVLKTSPEAWPGGIEQAVEVRDLSAIELPWRREEATAEVESR